MTASQPARPTCPACAAPFRDIEVAHLDSQRSLAAASGTQAKHRLVLFCGHRIEVTIERDEVSFRTL